MLRVIPCMLTEAAEGGRSEILRFCGDVFGSEIVGPETAARVAGYLTEVCERWTRE